ncbi:MAG: hypothetical protein KKI02_08260 [Planctomycetes bacterium]|nr:hypothetical protein [Planctomycetota bacterium]
MNNDDMPPNLQNLRLIIPAMAMGVILFAAIVIFLITGGSMSTNPELANVLLFTLVALAVMELAAYVVVRKVITGNLRRRWLGHAVEDVPPEELLKWFQTLTLVGAAMAEGLSLFGLVILLVTGNWLAIVAPAIGLLLIARHFPTRDKLNRFGGNVTGQHWS